MDQNLDINVRTLIEECRNGNREALNLFYLRFAPLMLSVVRRYIPDENDSEDILHDGFVIALSRLDSLREPRAVEYWLAMIMRNLALRYLQAQDVAEILHEIPEVEDTPPLPELLDMDTLEMLIRKLPEGYQKVFRLAILENKSHREIARLLGIEPHTSSSQLFRAKMMMRKLITDYKRQAGLLMLLLLVAFSGERVLVERGERRAESVLAESILVESGERRTESVKNIGDGGKRIENRELKIEERELKIEESRELLAENSPLSGQDSTLSADDSTISADNSTLSADNSTISADNSTLSADNSTISADNSTLSADNSTISADNSTLSADNSTISADNSTLSADNSPLSADNATLSALRSPLSTKNISVGVSLDPGYSFSSVPGKNQNNIPTGASGGNPGLLPVDPDDPTGSENDMNSADMTGPVCSPRREADVSDYNSMAHTNHLPVSFSLAINYPFNSTLSLESGLTYSYLRTTFEKTRIRSRCNWHYLGIPLKLNVRAGAFRRVALYASAGARMDIPLYSYAEITKEWNTSGFAGGRFSSPVVWSLSGSLGISLRLTDRIALFAEPTLQYHFSHKVHVPNTWSDNRWGFSLPIGFRFICK